MVVAFLGVINVWVDAALEYGVVGDWASGGPGACLCKLYIEEGRDMAEVENICVSKLDGLLGEFLLREHGPGDDIPSAPEDSPVGEGRESIGGVERGSFAEGRVCSLEHVKAWR